MLKNFIPIEQCSKNTDFLSPTNIFYGRKSMLVSDGRDLHYNAVVILNKSEAFIPADFSKH